MKRLVISMAVISFFLGILFIGDSAEAAKFRIGATRGLLGSYEVIADRMGYWKKEGLDYTLTVFKQGKQVRNGIIQNNLETGTTGFSPSLRPSPKVWI